MLADVSAEEGRAVAAPSRGDIAGDTRGDGVRAERAERGTAACGGYGGGAGAYSGGGAYRVWLLSSPSASVIGGAAAPAAAPAAARAPAGPGVPSPASM